MIKVSIIVPVYNTSKYLNKCLDSLINQTLKDIEIIIINDGSTDNSESIIKKYQDKRIKYYSQKNSGIGKTRNLGISVSEGQYLSFIDSDDYIAPNFCEVMYNKAIKDKCDIVVSNFYLDKGPKTKELFTVRPFKEESIKNNPEIIYNINLGPCNKIYSKKLILANNIKFAEDIKYEDVPFVCEALKYANKIGKIEDYLSYYVIHNNSETTIRDEKVFDIFKVTDRINNIYKDLLEVDYYLKKTNIRNIVDYMFQERYQKDLKVAYKFIDKAYTYLDNYDSNWKKNDVFIDLGRIKSFVAKNKLILKTYIKFYKIFNK